MKHFLVVYVGLHVGGVAGPLPYDQVECEIRAAAMEDARQRTLASGIDAAGLPIDRLMRERIASLRFACELRHRAPAITFGEDDA